MQSFCSLAGRGTGRVAGGTGAQPSLHCAGSVRVYFGAPSLLMPPHLGSTLRALQAGALGLGGSPTTQPVA